MPRLSFLLDALSEACSLPLNAWRAAETRNALLAIEEEFDATTQIEETRELAAA